MAMIATSDCTAPMAIRTAARMATLNGGVRATPLGTTGPLRPIVRPINTKSTTGIKSDPATPMGSRTNTLISTHVSFQKPRSISPVSRVR